MVYAKQIENLHSTFGITEASTEDIVLPEDFARITSVLPPLPEIPNSLEESSEQSVLTEYSMEQEQIKTLPENVKSMEGIHEQQKQIATHNTQHSVPNIETRNVETQQEKNIPQLPIEKLSSKSNNTRTNHRPKNETSSSTENVIAKIDNQYLPNSPNEDYHMPNFSKVNSNVGTNVPNNNINGPLNLNEKPTPDYMANRKAPNTDSIQKDTTHTYNLNINKSLVDTQQDNRDLRPKTSNNEEKMKQINKWKVPEVKNRYTSHNYKVAEMHPKIYTKHHSENNQHLQPILTTNDYKNMLFQAIKNNDTITVSRLLDIVKTTETTLENGDTPLLFAIKYSDISTIRMLIARGAKITHKNKQGLNAIQTAHMYKKNDVINTLKSINIVNHYAE